MSSDAPARALPRIELRHGEAIAVLSRLGFQGQASDSTFHEYIKSLRRLGVPFDRGALGYLRRGHPNYTYSHLMELSLVLTLRVYYVVPDALLNAVANSRDTMYGFFDRAYIERATGLGRPVPVRLGMKPALYIKGVFLDLQFGFAGGKLDHFGPPTLLSPAEAVLRFAESGESTSALLPINLSRLSERVVAASHEIQRTVAKHRAPARREHRTVQVRASPSRFH